MKRTGAERARLRLVSIITAGMSGTLSAGVVMTSVLALTGCVAKRTNASKPAIVVPPSWSSSGEGIVFTSSEDLSKWWERFGDSTLSSLIGQALKNNTDLRTALARLREARAQRNLAAANRFPRATFSVSNSTSKTSGSATTDQLSASFDASWEADMFSAKGNALQAASADARATEADLHNTQVSLAAEVALNYVELRSFQSRIEIARRNTASQAETLQLTEWRAQAGLVSSVDVEQARTNLEQTRAGIPSLETGIAENEHRLAVLVGTAPGALKQQLDALAPLPSLPDTVAVAIPADTLRQRPDVRAAQQRIIAETARLRQTEAARYPSFSLSGSLGIEKLTGNALGSVTGGTLAAATGGVSKVAAFSGSVLQTIFDRGRIRSEIEIQNAVQEQAVIAYEATVLTALEDVENALVSLEKSRERLAALNVAGTAARSAALLARDRYTAGLADFTTVLDTERTVLAVEDNIAQTQADRISALIQLYKALGGGWSANPGAIREWEGK
jgi:NodT family efflux transporter outer membrane factor (OMF) lipoprotein